ncbi:MAG TPA: DUF1080 domain-containing protein [Woeseiaceae bacterium]|nr:DUF1080 domain-containing protein [Woeseiaceae bacterium]
MSAAVRLCTAFLLALAVTASQAGESGGGAKSELESWQRFGASVWRYDTTGVEAGPGEEPGYLVSVDAYDNFHLSIDFWVADGTNSGIFIRCGKPAVLDDVNSENCLEVNIWDNHPNQDFRTGSIVTKGPPLVHIDSIGHWNTYEIDARDAHVEVRLNGELTAVLDDDIRLTGYVALQYAGKGLLRFRNLRIERY